MSINYIGQGRVSGGVYDFSQCNSCGSLYPHVSSPYPMCNGKPVTECSCNNNSSSCLPLHEVVDFDPETANMAGLEFQSTSYGFWRFNFNVDQWVFQEL